MKKILFYGAGNISQALIMGLLSSGFNKNNIEYIDRNLSNQKNLKKLKIKKAEQKNISKIDVFVLAVKPKDALEAYNEIIQLQDKPKIISLVAGIKTQKYLESNNIATLMRAMPNTSSRFCQGITALFNKSFSERDFKFVKKLFSQVGFVIELDKEQKMNQFTGLIGSGPAYFFYILKVYEKELSKMCNGDMKIVKQMMTSLIQGVATSITDNNNLYDEARCVAKCWVDVNKGTMTTNGTEVTSFADIEWNKDTAMTFDFDVSSDDDPEELENQFQEFLIKYKSRKTLQV